MGNYFRENIQIVGLKTLVVFLSVFYFSCGRESKIDTATKDGTSYYLEKVDSIRIDRENRVSLLDFNPVSKHFLAYDQVTQEFLVLDQRGKVLEAIYRVGEGPNEYTSNLVAASFNEEEGGYFTLSSRDFLSFNEKWEVKKRIRFASHIQIVYYTGPRHRVPNYTLPGISEPYVFTNFFSGTNPGSGEEGEEITSKYLIELYNPQKEDLEWVLPYDPQRLPDFQLNEDNKQTKPTPVFALDNEANVLYLTFEGSKEVGIYDLANDFGLIEKIGFDHGSFARTKRSRNMALFNFSTGTLGVLYFMGSDAANQAKQAADPDYSPSFDPSLYRLIVVQDGIQQENEIEFPLSCEPRSEMLPLPDNRILLHDKYIGEGEPEYSSYSIFELKAQ